MTYFFKKILQTTLISLSLYTTTHAIALESQIPDMHHKIENLHYGFGLIFMHGNKEGHDILIKINEIALNSADSQQAIELNKLVIELNAIFKTVRNIISKYKDKGAMVLPQFLFDIGRSCNLEVLFKDTIEKITNIIALDPNSCHNAKLYSFLDFVKKIQPIWHEVLANKTTLICNLRNSL